MLVTAAMFSSLSRGGLGAELTSENSVCTSCRRRACPEPLVIALKSETQSVVVDAQDALGVAAHRIRPHELHLLRHHPDVALVTAVIAEAVEAKAIVETTQEGDVVLDGDVGSTAAAAATTAAPSAATSHAHPATTTTTMHPTAARSPHTSAAARPVHSAATATAANIARTRGALRPAVGRAVSATLGGRLVAALVATAGAVLSALALAGAFIRHLVAAAFLAALGVPAAFLASALTTACALLACTTLAAETLAVACTTPAAEALAIARTISCALPAELLRGRVVAVRHVTAMRPVMIPVAAPDVRPVEGVVAAGVDVDVSGPPVRAPPNRRADHCARGKSHGSIGKCAGDPAGRLVIVWRVGRIRPLAVSDCRIIDRHVSHLWIRTLDHDALDGLAARGRHRNLRHLHLL